MKTFFLFFLLVNVVYFYFQSSAEDESERSVLLTQPTLPAGAKPLVLLRERGLKGSVSVPVDAVPSNNKPVKLASKGSEPSLAKKSPVIPPKRTEKKVAPKPQKSAEAACFTFGPFSKADSADKAVKAAKALGVSVERRRESQRTPKGYWVYLPPSKSYRAAKRKVSEMQKKGLTDLFIMGEGSRKNAISLGLFKSKKTAEDRLKQVSKMGLKAKFETQYRVSEQTWLDMVVAGDQTSTVAALTEVTESFASASLTQRKCR